MSKLLLCCTILLMPIESSEGGQPLTIVEGVISAPQTPQTVEEATEVRPLVADRPPTPYLFSVPALFYFNPIDIGINLPTPEQILSTSAEEGSPQFITPNCDVCAILRELFPEYEILSMLDAHGNVELILLTPYEEDEE